MNIKKTFAAILAVSALQINGLSNTHTAESAENKLTSETVEFYNAWR